MKRLLFFMLHLSLGSVCLSQPLLLTVDECVQLGLSNSHTLKASELQTEAAGARYREASRARFFRIYGVGNYRRLSPNIPDFEILLPDSFLGDAFDTDLFVQPAILDRYNLQLRFDQPLFQGFRLEAGRQAASYGLDAAQHQYTDTRNELNFAIRRAYWNVYESAALLEVLDTALALVEEQLQGIQKRIEHGMALQSDLLAIQTRRSEVRLQRVEAENRVQVAQLQLNHLMGQPLDREIEPASTIELDAALPGVEAFVDQAVRQQPGLEVARSELAAQTARLRMERAGFYPQISLSGVYDYARPNAYFFPQEDVFHGTWEAGFTVSLDLWNWGRTQARVREARATVATLEERVADAHSSIELEVRSLALELERSTEAVRVVAQGLEEARELYRVIQEQYRQGVAMNTELLNAELSLRTAETAHVQALVAYAIARADLYRATGNLSTL